MREAIKEAQKALETGDFPIGSVLVYDDEIVARAHNTSYSDKNRLAHAEIKVLNQSQDLLEKHKGEIVLYTTYEPCPMCFGSAVLMKLKRVVSGIDIDQSGCFGLLNHLPPFWNKDKFKFEVTKGVLADECKEVFLKGHMASDYVVESK